MAEQECEVAIVIPNYNGLCFLKDCLTSIDKQTFPNWQLIVVDNGSTDGSLDYLHNSHPLVRVISLSENRGFSAAVNAGIQSSSAPYVFLLNNDVELPDDCLEQLVTAGRNKPDISFFAPRMLSFHERDVLDGAGDGYLRGGAGYRLGTMEQDSAFYDRPGAIFGACAGAVLYRRIIFERIGFFDEDFFAYLEDVDLNLRMSRAGLRGWYVPAARVYHIGSATSGSKINPFTIRLSTRNSLYVLLKNYSAALFLRLLPVIAIYQFFWLLFVIKKGQFLPYCQGLWQAVCSWRMVRKKHARLIKEDRLTAAEFANRLQGAEQAVIDSIMRRRSAAGKGNSLLRLYGAFFL